MPKISVITPAYNAAAHIGRTISSVQTQTFADWEHIIIDDGSMDSTRATVDACRDERVRYRYQRNQGPSEARNHGIRLSAGEFLIFLDAGDWWTGHALETLWTCLRNAESGAIAHGDWAFADGVGNVGRARSSAFTAGEGLNTLLLFNPMAIHTVLAPRQAIVEAGSFAQDGMLEDWHLWLRLAREGWRFVHIPELVAYYHKQPGSRSRNIDRRKSEGLATLDELWASIDADDPLQAIRERSYATACIDLCVSRFGQDDVAQALDEFDAAVAFYPQTIGSIDTYYRIAYAEQSAHEGAAELLCETLEETAAASRIEQLLGHIETNYSRDEARAAHRAAHTALGLAHYHERRHAPARGHLWSAVRADPKAIFDHTVGSTLAKTLLPVNLLDSVRKRRREQY